jgi:hypothetical protein
MTINTFVKLPIVRFGIHFIIVVGVLFNCIQLYRISKLKKEVEENKLLYSVIKNENNEGKNRKDYYNSSLYKEIYAKEKQYKVRDEVVLDTQDIEGDNQNIKEEYIPQTTEVKEYPNYIKWFQVLTRTGE